MKNQDIINSYFEHHWASRGFSKYKYSGTALANKINPGESVLDVGCGYNPFKGVISNLVGIDPANDAADIRIAIEDFKPQALFNVAFCLGSINFGGREDIRAAIRSVVQCLTPAARIYWRCNPGLHDHASQEFHQIEVYPWTVADHFDFASEFGFTVQTVGWDTNDRIYAEWVR